MKFAPRLPFVLLAALVASNLGWAAAARAEGPDGKLRIICFGAHPDDAEYKAGGVAAKWAALGHHVKFVSVTNGDIGHWQSAGGPLALRRTAEVKQAAKLLGIETEVLDIHDGELLPTLENRRTITRLIRQWKADVVLSHRPNDYHPDHRYTGVLVQDAAYMVTVPFICPDTPPLASNPVFFFYSDGFQKPNPFTADVVVGIDDTFAKKIEAVHALPSQVYEGGATGSEAFVKDIPKDDAGRKAWAVEHHGKRYAAVADKFRDALVKWYGTERGKAVQYAEAFEICEYGRRPSAEELKKLFPFFGP
jgi:N-acetylglucosamine malate deacetylase 1